MSQLGKQLQSAKQAHQAARYSGDLAADVLMPPMSIRRQLLIGTSVAAGIAAMLAMIVWLGRPASVNQQIAELPQTEEAQPQKEAAVLLFTIERPTEASFTPDTTTSDSTTAPSFSATSIPAVWGFPTVSSIQDELATGTQSEEESS